MNVQDLINDLNKIKDKTVKVVIQQDDEGNGFRYLNGSDLSFEVSKESYSEGEYISIFDDDCQREYIDDGWDEDTLRELPQAVVLF